jgi:hypothetical protein
MFLALAACAGLAAVGRLRPRLRLRNTTLALGQAGRAERSSIGLCTPQALAWGWK